MPWLLFLGKYWKYIVLVLLLVGIFGYWKSLTHTIDKQSKQIIQLKVDIEVGNANFQTCTDANQKFAELARTQNDEIERQATANKKITTRYNELAARFAQIRQENAKIKTELANVPWDRLDCEGQVSACYEVLESVQ